ncbi:putative Esterase/lipase/thioesterase family protein [Hibiscus syriacus]|uniref:Esterase/lipase/thioesterase family protein n=1 Tax=Hibiscus syriacus TaxID=106335 RepID=A0A6A3A2A4_HIBSY|nr:putative Esterase/lipase/thioesterase family protein [Hibiscus syriacus]
MAAIGASMHLAAGVSPFSQRHTATSFGRIQKRDRIFAVSTERVGRRNSFGENEKVEKIMMNQKTVKGETDVKPKIYANPEDIPEYEEDKKLLKDYIEECKEIIRSDGGPPRWFSPLECSSSTSLDCPLLLFCLHNLTSFQFSGIDGTGLGLIMHHHKLGKMFNIWCLHIPVQDRTPFNELVKLVETTIRSENSRSPNRPIYLVAESLGACLALSVAARNPNLDLVLVLSNPASFNKSQANTDTLLDIMPDQFPLNLPYMLSLPTGNPLRMLMDNVVKRGLLPQTIEDLSQNFATMSTYLPVLTDILPRETLRWKLNLLKSGSDCANTFVHGVKAQILLLCSGRDQLLPSQEECQRLQKALPDCEIRKFEESGHFLFLEDNVDLVTTIKAAAFYRRGKQFDWVSDYVPPTPCEFKKVHESMRWLLSATGPVMLSTLEDGKVVRGLQGIPSEGPVLFVGYHMLMGIEIVPLVAQLLMERNILVRGIAHPVIFVKGKDGNPPDMDPSNFDIFRLMGSVPVSAASFFKLMSSKSHILLYPGGAREALHRKGEAYKLFWPEKTEFVRMAARFGAKIVPFGVVGGMMSLRVDASGEVANQQMYLPVMLPKFPGRFYYYFGKPILSEGMKVELRDKKKCDELYLHLENSIETRVFDSVSWRPSEHLYASPVACRRFSVADHHLVRGITKRGGILAVSTERIGRGTGFGENEKLDKKMNLKTVTEETEVKPNIYANPEELPEFEEGKKWLKDYFEECKEMIRSDGGPPRWFSPLECSSSTSPDCPLHLFLPDLVKLVERTIRSENYRSPNRPIYIVAESLGACLAFSVAARNPDIDLVLVFSNPATSFSKSQLQPLIPLLEIMPDQFPLNLTYMLSLPTGPLPQIMGELSQDLAKMSSDLPVSSILMFNCPSIPSQEHSVHN